MSMLVRDPAHLDFSQAGVTHYQVAFHLDASWGYSLVPLTVINGTREAPDDAAVGVRPGVAVFGGTHGNEYEGQVVVAHLRRELHLSAGTRDSRPPRWRPRSDFDAAGRGLRPPPPGPRPAPAQQNTITSLKRLKEHVAQVRRQGYAVDDEEEEIGTRCIGCPVVDATGMAVAAISIAGTTAQLESEPLTELAAEVRRTADGIAAQVAAQLTADAASARS